MNNNKKLTLALALLFLSSTSCQTLNRPTPPDTDNKIENQILSDSKGEKVQDSNAKKINELDLIKAPDLTNGIVPDSKGPKLSPDTKGPKLTPDTKGPKLTPDTKGPKLTPDTKGPKLTPDTKGPKLTPDSKGPNSNINLPPLEITIPPLGFTFPPRGFTAIKGRILLPSRFNNSQFSSQFSIQNISSSLKILVNDQEPQGNIAFYGSQLLNDGSLALNYFLSQIDIKQDIQLSIVTTDKQQVLLKALALQKLEGTIVNQNLNSLTTALALIKQEKPELKVFDILESTNLNTVQTSVESHLSTASTPDITLANEIKDTAKQTASNIVASTKQVTAVDVSKSSITMKENSIDSVQATVNFDDNSTSSLALWTSSQPDVAIVNNQGYISALKPGKATLTVAALADQNKTATLNVEVVSANNNPTALQVQMVSPLNNSNHPIGTQIRLEAEVTNPPKTEIGQVEFKVNGEIAKNGQGEHGIIKWKTDSIQILSGLADFTWYTSPHQPGEHKITVVLKDLNDNIILESSPLTINLVAP